MFTFERKLAKQAADIWWQTGKPDSGFALCKHHYALLRLIDKIEPLDVANMRKAFSAVMQALRPHNPDLVKEIMDYHTSRELGVV